MKKNYGPLFKLKNLTLKKIELICGSKENRNERCIFEKLGSLEGSTKVQGGFVIESFCREIIGYDKVTYFDFNFWRVDILRLSFGYSKIPYEYKKIKR